MTFNNGVKSTFTAEGMECAATLFGADDKGRQAPAILMIHGWGGTQLVLFKDFIRRFNDAGYAVMTFDYPGWGASPGIPRNRINPWERVRVADAALAHLKSMDRIDEDRIVIWGTSFGGGHAIDLAAEHPEVAGVVAHVPMLNGLAAVAAVPFMRMLRFSLDIALDLINPFKRRYIPIVSDEGGYSTMDRDGAGRLRDWVDEELNGKYDNRVTAVSLLTMGPYQPGRNLSRITIPGLIVGALHDTVAPFDEVKVRRKAGENFTIITIEGNHFDPYLQPWFEENVSNQLAFLKRVLG
ncbi:alpha/beta fold hydrolase [Venatoribacter cucullus]|uniref:Alpha/beta fold hydrolase n=1 Tax=Venatoribacter cucullus TaxID=2661630 RepID=A0A9X7UW78_9GAMM|nr:alpha/beta fold hydrolase [Venatoribacter cucullus]QQD24187.1 alpha/beta fold hydrolase [Venatoribacter cucullus]